MTAPDPITEAGTSRQSEARADACKRALVSIADAVLTLGWEGGEYDAVTLGVSRALTDAILEAGGRGHTSLYEPGRVGPQRSAIDGAEIVCEGVLIAVQSPVRPCTPAEIARLDARKAPAHTGDEADRNASPVTSAAPEAAELGIPVLV